MGDEVIEMTPSPHANWAPATSPTKTELDEARALGDSRRQEKTRARSRFSCGQIGGCLGGMIGSMGTILVVCILIAAILALPIGMIYVGWKCNNRSVHCPPEDLPNVLLAGGIIFVTQGFVAPSCGKKVAKLLNGLVGLAEFCWFISAAVLVYRSDFSDTLGDPNYCRPVVYKFVWWFVTVTLGLSGVSVLLGICAICVARR